MPQNNDTQIAIVGAGPIGIELAITLKLLGIPYIHFDKMQIGQMIYNFPPDLQFFSSNERISIAGIPIPSVDQQKATREEYLAYLRMVVKTFKLNINTYEDVVQVSKSINGFQIHTTSQQGQHIYTAPYVVLATGSTSHPRTLSIPGENMPHVSHMLGDIHQYFNKKIVIVGSKNSAAEAALRCYHVGADVTMVIRKPAFHEKEVKYWLLPELLGLISKGDIKCYFESTLLEIFPGKVFVQDHKNETKFYVEADFVIKAIGYLADISLFKALGVNFHNEHDAPEFNPQTMETNVAGLYAAGTVTAGTQKSYKIFLENCHEHVEKIAKDICVKLGLGDRFEDLKKSGIFRTTFISKSTALEE